MKKIYVRILSLALALIAALLCFASCSEKEPYPYDLDKYIVIPQTIPQISVSDEEIEALLAEHIQSARENVAESVPVINRGATFGDTVTLSVVCYYLETFTQDRASGNNIQVLTDEDCVIRLGDGKYPSELEVAMAKKTVGDIFTVQATLPKTYTVDGLGGKNVVYVCEVKSVKTLELPEYNDELIKRISVYDSVAEYEANMRVAIKEEIIFERFVDLCEIKMYPTEEVNSYTSDYISHYTELAYENEMTLEEYVGNKFFIELNEFHLKGDAYARNMVKKELVLYALSRKYGIELTSDEYNARAYEYAQKYGFKNIGALESNYGESFVRKTVLLDKVMSYLRTEIEAMENAKADTDNADNTASVE